jgi:hypothetical protein
VTSTQSQCCVDGTVKWEGRLATFRREREMYRGVRLSSKRERERELGGKADEGTERRDSGKGSEQTRETGERDNGEY